MNDRKSTKRRDVRVQHAHPLAAEAARIERDGLLHRRKSTATRDQAGRDEER
ncbi:MAG: hypothetical protein ACRDO1_01560 [Nocardioidaceae bacterium]